jgi:hypothetical protein
MRPAYNFEPKYRVMVLTREDWTKGTVTPPMSKRHVWFKDGSRMCGGGPGLGSMGNPIEGGSVFPWENMPQSSRQKYLPSWPVHKILKFIEYQRNA